MRFLLFFLFLLGMTGSTFGSSDYQLKAFDWSLVLQLGPVIFIGEVHSSAVTKSELHKALPLLKKAGITHVALEMINSHHNDILDEVKNGDQTERLLNYFEEEWGWLPLSYATLVVGLMDELEVVGIDKRRVNRESMSIEELGQDRMRVRDEHMALKISQILEKDPRAKILVLAGAAHVEKNKQPLILKQKYGVDSKSYRVLIQRDYWSSQLETHKKSKGSWLIIPQDLKREKVDGYIHLPSIINDKTPQRYDDFLGSVG